MQISGRSNWKSVAIGSTSLYDISWKKDAVPGRNDAEMSPVNSHTLRRNTAIRIKDLILTCIVSFCNNLT